MNYATVYRAAMNRRMHKTANGYNGIIAGEVGKGDNIQFYSRKTNKPFQPTEQQIQEWRKYYPAEKDKYVVRGKGVIPTPVAQNSAPKKPVSVPPQSAVPSVMPETVVPFTAGSGRAALNAEARNQGNAGAANLNPGQWLDDARQYIANTFGNEKVPNSVGEAFKDGVGAATTG